MKKRGLSYIRKWLSIYLAMVMLITVLLYIIVYVEVTGMMAILDTGRQAGSAMDTTQAARSLLAGMQLRLVLVLSGGLIISALLGYMWMGWAARRLGRPVRIISNALSKLAKGQLNETVTIETSDEFEQIGSGINELAANLQELLLHIWKQSGQCLALIENIQCNPDMRNDKKLTLEGLGYLKQLSESIDDLRDMAKAYVFYDVSIEGSKTTAVADPGKECSEILLDDTPKDYN